MENFRYILRQSSFGPVGIVWWRQGRIVRVRRIVLSRGDDTAAVVIERENPRAKRGSCEVIDAVTRKVGDFLSGKDVEFDLSLLDLSRCGHFQRSVLVAEAGIPRGWTSTYGRIARYMGRPRAARAVGTALARNPFPVMIPCHRAIREDGGLGGFQGGTAMKRTLLENEGILFSAKGRVLTENVYY